MPDPQIEMFCRIADVAACRHDVFRRFQRYLRDEIQPKLDAYEALKATQRATKAKPTEAA